MSDRLVVHDADVDTATIAEYEATRRDAVRRGLAFGGAALAASSIPLLLGVRNAFAKADGDAAILEKAVGLEQTAVFTYTAAVATGKLGGPATAVAKLFAKQEQEHLDGLSAALKDLGGALPVPPKAVADIAGLTAAARSAKGILSFAIELETMALAAYYDAHKKLSDAKLLQTGAQIMANEGQHLVVLRTALGRNPVPNAFETGVATQ